MKKLAFVLCLSLLMLASVALADQTIQTEHFEADLSGNSARFGRYYVVNKTGALDFQEFDFEGYSEESMDAAPDFIVELFKTAFVQNMVDYGGNLRSEPMKIAGKPSALFTFTGKNSTDDIYVGFSWGDEVICYMVYADTVGKTAKEDFIAILGTLRKIGDHTLEAQSSAPAASTATISKKKESTIYDDHNIKAVISNLRIEYSEYLAADLTVYNNSDAKIFVILEDTYLNGWKVTNMGSAKISEGKSGKNMIIWYDSGSAAGIKKLSDLKQISFTVEIVNADTYEPLYFSDEITLQYE